MRTIPESDWKKMRKMQTELLDMACKRIFEKIDKVSSKREGNHHKAYLNLWKLMRREDQNISTMFDDVKRSNAFFKLASWKHSGLISNETLSEFSDETRQVVQALNEGF